MKAISEGIYQRGKHGTKDVRRRIPADIRAAYPPVKSTSSEASALPTCATPKSWRVLNLHVSTPSSGRSVKSST
jgi:hypothetical protein